MKTRRLFMLGVLIAATGLGACGGGDDDIVVAVLVPLDGVCPTGTVGHRDRQGLGIACVAA